MRPVIIDDAEREREGKATGLRAAADARLSGGVWVRSVSHLRGGVQSLLYHGALRR
ncbi:hypothetical protein BT93_L5465 [Corymbia citriodora subsp. variegata]|uniref:Uncharacterized protein n=1 Tax=Corymbia citriodora subsp. variegata TaxID=360336 RepID=A0A8T0CTJ7_CORYI|nr:hypothetical protein BT93_L5465 [Corymbia citriodora subsp. variegata]